MSFEIFWMIMVNVAKIINWWVDNLIVIKQANLIWGLAN